MPDSSAMNFLDQNVRTTGSPKFANLTVVGTLTAAIQATTTVTATTGNITTVASTTVGSTTVNVGADAVAGTLNVWPTTTVRGKATITCTNQTGNTVVGIVVGAMGQATVVTLPDPGAATSWLLQTTAACAAVTPVAAEFNSLKGQPAAATMTTVPASGACGVQLTVKDSAGVALDHAVSGIGYVSSSTGLAIAAATTVATLTNGIITQLVAGTIFHYITSAAGLLGITLTAAAGSYYVTLQMPNGKLVTTGAIVCNA